MYFSTHFMGNVPSIRAQYPIELPGSLHTNKIPVIFGGYSLCAFFCSIKKCFLNCVIDIFVDTNTDVMQKSSFLVDV